MAGGRLDQILLHSNPANPSLAEGLFNNFIIYQSNSVIYVCVWKEVGEEFGYRAVFILIFASYDKLFLLQCTHISVANQ